MNFIKENLRRANKDSIIIVKPGENKRGDESFSGFKRKIVSDSTDPPDLQLTEFVHLFLECKLAVKNDTKVTSCIGKWDTTVTHT